MKNLSLLFIVFLLLQLNTLAQTKIAFQSDRDGNQEIYVMNADGSELKILINFKINIFAG